MMGKTDIVEVPDAAMDIFDTYHSRRGLIGKCWKFDRGDMDTGFTIHIHVPSIFKPWKEREVGVVNNENHMGFRLTLLQAGGIARLGPNNWIELMALLRGKLAANRMDDLLTTVQERATNG